MILSQFLNINPFGATKEALTVLSPQPSTAVKSSAVTPPSLSLAATPLDDGVVFVVTIPLSLGIAAIPWAGLIFCPCVLGWYWNG